MDHDLTRKPDDIVRMNYIEPRELSAAIARVRAIVIRRVWDNDDIEIVCAAAALAARAVPREPTQAMLDAAYEAGLRGADDTDDEGSERSARDIWRAMYDAAPLYAHPQEPK